MARFRLCLLLVGALLIPGAAIAAEGAESYSVTVSPVRLDLSAAPGASVEATIVVSNSSGSAITLSAETVDFVSDDQSGKPTFVPTGASEWSMSPWVKTAPASFSLEPGEDATVTVTIAVPEDGEPGGHYAAVLFSSKPTAGGDTAVVAKVGTLLLLTVDGDINESGAATIAAPWIIAKGPLATTVSFVNNGNVHVAPEGFVIVRGLRGGEVERLAVGGENVLPSSSRTFAAAWKDVPVFGVYRVSAELDYGSGKSAATDPRTVIVAPWPYILAGLVIFLAGLIPGLLLRRKKE